MNEPLYAQLHVVYYRWPDEEICRMGYIIQTNCEDWELASQVCGISDDNVLIYTDTLDAETISRNFDGLKVELIKGIPFRKNQIGGIINGRCEENKRGN